MRAVRFVQRWPGASSEYVRKEGHCDTSPNRVSTISHGVAQSPFGLISETESTLLVTMALVRRVYRERFTGEVCSVGCVGRFWFAGTARVLSAVLSMGVRTRIRSVHHDETVV